MEVASFTPEEEASLSRHILIYDTIFLVLTYVDISMQLYVILVMLAATPDKMRQYRFFMMLYTLCDLTFAFIIGVALHPVPIGIMPCAAWRGIFQSLDRHGARFGFAVALFCGTAVLSAQDYCIIYRGAVVVDEGRQLKRLVTKKARLIGLLVILAMSSMNGFVGYFLTTFEYAPEDYPALRVIMNQGSDAFICISIGESPIYPAPRIVLPFAGIMEVTFYCLAIATVVFIRRASMKMSQKSKTLNSQLSWLLLTQTTVPIVCIFVPFLLVLLPMFFKYRVSAESTMIGFLVFSSFPLINAVLTIAFVKPYRDFTLHLLVRRKNARNSVVWTTDQQAAAAARAGARNQSISTSSLRNTHSPGHSII